MKPVSIEDRVKGGLYGVAVGDALGATVEFMSRDKIREKYGELRDIVGGGWLNLRPGEWTDDGTANQAGSGGGGATQGPGRLLRRGADEMAQQKIRADLILRQIAKRHAQNKDLFITEVKDGPTIWGEHRRIDAIAIKRSWRHPCITGYEVKVSRKDYERDEKWPGYREICHKLYFACPAGLIQPGELPEDVGLIWYNPEKRTIFTKKAAVFRDIEIPWQMLYYLVICRTDSDRHPFFSSRREFLEAWVEDKEERQKLGFYVSNKISKEIDDLKRQIRELKREADRGKEAISELEKVRAVLGQMGLRRTGYGWIDELEQVLKSGVPTWLAQSVNAIDRELGKIKSLIEKAALEAAG